MRKKCIFLTEILYDSTLVQSFIDVIKNGKPITYYNIEMSREEVEKRFLNTFHENKKSMLNDRVLKHNGFKNKPNKEM